MVRGDPFVVFRARQFYQEWHSPFILELEFRGATILEVNSGGNLRSTTQGSYNTAFCFRCQTGQQT